MKYLLAPDKFKGTLSAPEVSAAIAQVIRDDDPRAEVEEIPIADGGEGTAALLALELGAERFVRPTLDPLGHDIEAEFFLKDGEGYVDMSAASGLWLIDPADRDPLGASTYGTGILLRHLIELGATRINIGLGGSATIDAGLGMAAALGYEFSNSSGRRIEPLPRNFDSIQTVRSPVFAHLPKVVGLADVTNRLLGSAGATCTFGRQKGLRENQLAEFDSVLSRLVTRIAKSLGTDYSDVSRAGAAGGFGYGILTFLHGSLVGGFDAVAEKLRLPDRIAEADVVITGEGRLDSQSLQGKGPFGVASLARAQGKPVWAVAGIIEDAAEVRAAFDRLISFVDEHISTQEALAKPAEILRRRTRELLAMGEN